MSYDFGYPVGHDPEHVQDSVVAVVQDSWVDAVERVGRLERQEIRVVEAVLENASEGRQTPDRLALARPDELASAIMGLTTERLVKRNFSDPNPAVVRSRAYVELRLEAPEERYALFIDGQDGQRYVITRPSEAVYGDSPITLTWQDYEALRQSQSEQGFIHTLCTPQNGPFYSSPGGTTNEIHLESTKLVRKDGSSYTQAFSDDFLTDLSREVEDLGLSLLPIEVAALQTLDLATFTQMAGMMTADRLQWVIDVRNAMIAQEAPLSEQPVPEEFLTYSASAADLDDSRKAALRNSRAMRQLYARLADSDITSVDVEWAAFMRNAQTGEEKFLFAMVNDYRQQDGKIRREPLLVRDDTVGSLLRFGEGDETAIVMLRQYRAAAATTYLAEIVAGILEAHDFTGQTSVQHAIKRCVLREGNEETGIPPEVLERVGFMAILPCMYLSTRSTERMSIAWVQGETLPAELRQKLMATAHGEQSENEYTAVSFVQQSYDLVRAPGDLKSLAGHVLFRVLTGEPVPPRSDY